MNNFRDLSNCIRVLSADMVEKAGSGHPGMPLGFADVMTVLALKFLKFSPSNPRWFNRDRLILSAGHGSAMLYSFYYLAGYKDFTIDDIKTFRQLHSKAAGHPEYGIYNAIEVTTGPLAQGFGNSIGFAIAQKKYQDYFKNKKICNHKIYCIVGDGCLMEGLSYEAASLAGHLNLNNLIVLFDDNKITIDGKTSLAVSEDHIAKFKAFNWNAISVDGHDFDQINDAIFRAQNSDKPSFISFRTKIGYGAKNKEESEKSHGSPLGKQEILEMKERFNFPTEDFAIPSNLLSFWREEIGKKCDKEYNLWNQEFNKLSKSDKEYINFPNIDKKFLNELKLTEQKSESTRNYSSAIIEKLISNSNNKVIVGSADLSLSNCVKTNSYKAINKADFSGNFIHYGTREALMACVCNGLAIENFLSICGTFLVFSDYMRAGIRLSAIMKLPVIYLMTHDSIGVGEDGPTHQPIEHLASFRCMPNILVMRPCDLIESVECFDIATHKNNFPSIIALSRQKLNPIIRTQDYSKNFSMSGGYLIVKEKSNPDFVLIATGSELELCIKLKEAINKSKKFQNKSVNIVSIPCVELFLSQTHDYKKSILRGENVFLIEAGSKYGLSQIVIEINKIGEAKRIQQISINDFGLSGKSEELFKYFGFGAEKILDKTK